MKFLKSTFLLFLTSNYLFAQVTMFQRTYGGANDDFGRSAQQTFDGGYIVVGATSSYGAGNTDVYLFKTDTSGNTLWSKTFGGPNVDWGYSVQQTADTGYIIAGYTNSFGAGGYDVYLIKTDSMGNLAWQKEFGGTDWDWGYSVKQTTDGGYIVAGGTYSFGFGNEDAYVIKTDGNGSLMWDTTYGGANDDEAKSIKQTIDGGYIFCGYSKSFSDPNGDVFIVKTNPAGDTTWTRKYGRANFDLMNDVIEANNGDYILIGTTQSAALNFDIYFMRILATGDSIWTRVYGGPNYNHGASLVETMTNKIVFANTTADFGGGMKDFAIFHADAAGNYINNLTFGSNEDEEVYSLNKTSDNGFIMCGYTNGFNSANSNVYLVKTDSMGITSAIVPSVNEVQKLSYDFSAYPNPTTSDSYIEFVASKELININLYLTDVVGQDLTEMISYKVYPNKIILSTKNLSPGVYSIKFLSNDGFAGQNSFVIIK